MSQAAFHTTALFVSSCNIVDVAVEVEQRVAAMLQSKTRHGAFEPSKQMNSINAIEYERVAHSTRRRPQVHRAVSTACTRQNKNINLNCHTRSL